MNPTVRQTVSLFVALVTACAIWIILTISTSGIWTFNLDVLTRSPWLIQLFVLSDSLNLLPASAIAMLIYRQSPLLLGIICGLMATALVTAMTASFILFEPIFLAKWALFFLFSILGSYTGWWILGLARRREKALYLWQSLAIVCTVIIGLAAYQWLYINHYIGPNFTQ